MLSPERILRVRRILDVAVSTDDILPARYKHASANPADFRDHVFEHFMPGFAASLSPGDVIVARRIFGIGSSREQAVSALMATGIAAVIAPAFGRIFFRNSWNLALPALETANAGSLDEGDLISIDLSNGVLVVNQRSVEFAPVPIELLRLLKGGGLLASIRDGVYGHLRA